MKNHQIPFQNLSNRFQSCNKSCWMKKKSWKKWKWALKVILLAKQSITLFVSLSHLFVQSFGLITVLLNISCFIFLFWGTDETERYRSELMEVRAELEPWENQLIDHKGKLDVACAESKLLKEKVGVALFWLMEYIRNLYKSQD